MKRKKLCTAHNGTSVRLTTFNRQITRFKILIKISIKSKISKAVVYVPYVLVCCIFQIQRVSNMQSRVLLDRVSESSQSVSRYAR